MINLEINNSTRIRINRRLIEKAVLTFESVTGIKKAYFSLAMVGDGEMKRLNRDCRGKDKVTDVLSFAEEKDGFISQKEERGERYLGEIIICLAQAKRQARLRQKATARQAKEYDWSLNKEIVRLLIHGLAHLVGYDHEGVSRREAEKMQEFEGKVIMSLRAKP